MKIKLIIFLSFLFSFHSYSQYITNVDFSVKKHTIYVSYHLNEFDNNLSNSYQTSITLVDESGAEIVSVKNDGYLKHCQKKIELSEAEFLKIRGMVKVEICSSCATVYCKILAESVFKPVNNSKYTPTEFVLDKTSLNSNSNKNTSDIDFYNIKTKNKNPNAFAVIIGNKDYQHTKKVSFALNDAQSMKNYLINMLGYSEGNIFYLENATKSSFETFFGTKENPQGKLFNNMKQGISDVFIYYSGHGAPGLNDKKGYFVPIDCDPQYVEQGGYSLDLFYNNISKLNAKSITVITDACFSGAEIFKNISPITITISNPIAVADNCVVLTSSTGTQVSSWYTEKQHGMFTYFFLKALQDKDKSDKNKDDKLSFTEIFEYVSDKTEGVPYYARSIHGVDQTPTMQGTGAENVFIEYK